MRAQPASMARAMPGSYRADPRARDPRRVSREQSGRIAEWLAAAVLTLKGYRILARRRRTPWGEIDLIAVRGRRLSFVEVKRRQTREDGEASLTPFQTARLHDAAEHWLSTRRRYQNHDLAFDALLVVPWRCPIHLRDALQPTIGATYRSR